MMLHHHDLQIELDDLWWYDAGMTGFVTTEHAYRVAPDRFNRRMQIVPINDVGAVRRAMGVGIFNDDREAGLSARERVIRILQGIRLNDAIPPVEVVRSNPNHPYPYKLVAGTHRLYCSLAVGFTSIPAVEGYDITA
jgi:hypothetical protein